MRNFHFIEPKPAILEPEAGRNVNSGQNEDSDAEEQEDDDEDDYSEEREDDHAEQ